MSDVDAKSLFLAAATVIVWFADGTGSVVKAADVDPHYRFASVQAPQSPVKNTWSAFQTDTFTGNFGYQFKIAVPPGTNKLAPEVGLSYSSQAGRAKAGWVGAGWDVPLSYVQRDITFTRRTTGDDTFDLFLNGAKHDLVFVSAEGRYHTRIETWMKVEQRTDAPNATGAYWTAKTKDGTEYRFGYNPDAEAMANVSDGSIAPFVTRWYLDRIRDTNGNCIYYSYLECPSASAACLSTNDRGATYLSRIEYNNERKRVIDFVLEDADRPDYYLTMEQGSEVQEARRLKEIVVKVDGALVRRYALSYTVNAIGTRSLLSSITQYGSDDTSSLPPVTFQYQAFENGFGPKIDWETYGERFIRKVDPTTGNTITDMFDANGDGLLDLVNIDTDTPPVHYDIWLSTGRGFSENIKWLYESLPLRGLSKTALDESNTEYAVVDINRDGLPETVFSSGGDQLYVRSSLGQGVYAFNLPLPDSNSYIRRVKRTSGLSPNVDQQFMDLNGDGLPDYVKSDNVDHAWEIYWNTGGGFSGSYERWGIAFGTPWLEEYDDASDKTKIASYDVNGDGLVDLVDAGSDPWKVYLNTGSAFKSDGTWANDCGLFLNDTNSDGSVNREFLDLNGDGMADILDTTAGSTWKVRYSTGRDFTSFRSFAPPSAIASNQYSRHMIDGNMARDIFDITGDGLPDIVRKMDSSWEVYPGLGGQADLLEKVTDTLGGTVTVGYTSSFAFKNSRLPFNQWLVTSVATDNGMTGPHTLRGTTGYSYAGGLYDFSTREFRGFANVTEVKSDGSVVLHTYDQGTANGTWWEGMKGKEVRVELRGGISPLSATESQWHAVTIQPPFEVQLYSVSEYTYDGFYSNPRTTRKCFWYDNYGNITAERTMGDLDVENYDEFTIGRAYLYNTEAWIVDRVKLQFVSEAGDWPRQRETWYSYDGLAYGEVPTKGNLTREEAWLHGGNPVTLHEYDAFGNRTRTTDALGHATQIAYDPTFNSFPVGVTNAKGQVTHQMADPATGELLSQTDPNGFTTTFGYDVFGRKSKEVKPYDSEAFPTTGFSYALTGTPPGTVTVSKREAPGQPGTLDTISSVDGFGSLIQTKTEWQNAGNRIAVDYYYDLAGRVLRQSNPYLSDATVGYSTPQADAPAVSYRYDGAGRPVVVESPDGTQRLRVFDHWRVDETDENGRVKSYQFRHDKRLLQVTERNAGETYTTEYAYDPLGQLLQVVDHHRNTTTIGYDSLGRKTSMQDPDLGTWAYAYDAVGNLVRQTDARGVVTNIGYDALNRKTLIDYPSDADVQFVYDADGGPGTIGTLRQVTDAAGTVAYGYDQRLRKVREDRTMDGTTWTTQWVYDSLERPVSQTYPDGEVVEYLYSPQGTLAAIPGIVTSLSYSPAGRPTAKTYANGVSTSYDYDGHSQRLTRLYAEGLQDYRYSYDSVGNITRIADGVTGRTEVFGYDDLDRLTSAADEEYRRSYRYDALGNMLSVAKDGVQTDFSYGTTVRPHAVTGMNRPSPSATLAVNGGVPETASRSVVLNNAATGNPTHYMASESPVFDGASWQAYGLAPLFVLSAGDGTKTVHFKVKDRDGAESPAISDTIALAETVAVAVAYFRVNDDAAATATQTVTLNNVATGEPTEYLASESPSFAGAVWQPYAPAPLFALAPGNGSKTVYFKVRDATLAESATVADSIDLGVPGAPAVISFEIDAGAEMTRSRTVALSSSCTGSPTHFMASESPDFAGAVWATYADVASFVLGSPNGAKTVHFKVRNAAGAESTPVSGTIALDAPHFFVISSFALNGGAATTATRIVTLNSACEEAPAQYIASESPYFLGASWQPYAAAAQFVLSMGDGAKTVYFAVRNADGLESAVANDTITLDEPRAQTLVTNGYITGTETWGPGGTYVVGGALVVDGGSLTIMPGTAVSMQPGAMIEVRGGTLLAADAAFVAAEEGKPWRGIQFWWHTSDASRLEGCRIEGSDDALDCYHFGCYQNAERGVVFVYDSSPTITGCTIAGSNRFDTVGIRVEGGSPAITGNTFNHLVKGISVGWGYTPLEAAPLVTGNSFFHNGFGVEVLGFGGTYTDNTFAHGKRGLSVVYDGGLQPAFSGNSYIDNTEADVFAAGFVDAQAAVVWSEASTVRYRTSGVTIRGRLEIAPGHTVLMNEGAGLNVEGGTLVATDTVFTWAEEGKLWRGIQFWPGSDASRLVGCRIEGSDDANDYLHYGGQNAEKGVVYIWNSSPTISGCTIQGNSSDRAGIHVEGGYATVSGNTLNDLARGLAVGFGYTYDYAAPSVTGNTFAANDYGIEIGAGFGGTYTGNVFSGSRLFAMVFAGPGAVDATNNDWGHASGPFDPSDDRATGGWYNPGGLGGNVSNNVDYYPWAGCTIAQTATPTGLAGTPGDRQAVLAWNAGAEPGLSGYTIHGREVGGASLTPVHVGVAPGSTLTNLTNGTTYALAVSSRNEVGGESAPSAEIFVTPRTVPDAPTIGTATAGDGQATVSFTPPAWDGGSAITGYTVTASPGGMTGTGNSSTISVAGLTNCTAYTLRVTATNAAGAGAPSGESNSVVPTGYVVAPTALVVRAAGGLATVNVSGAPTCSWAAASNAAWLSVVSGSSGSGAGVVTVYAAPNSGAARTGTLTVADRTVSVAQDAVTLVARFVGVVGDAVHENPFGPAPLAVTFDASGSEGPGVIENYHWDFGDGATADTSGATIAHGYPVTGSYPATLTVTLGALSDSTQRVVTVADVVHLVTTAAELQAALTAAQHNGKHDLIRIAEGTYLLSANGGEHFSYVGAAGEDKDLVLEGGWTGDFALRAYNVPTVLRNDLGFAQPLGGILSLDGATNAAGGNFAVDGLTLVGGSADGYGGGLCVLAGGNISLSNSAVIDSVSASQGGGIYLRSESGAVWVTGNALTGNAGAGSGAGEAQGLAVYVSGNAVSGNGAPQDAGLVAAAAAGGELIVSNNTIHGNQAAAGSSGLAVDGGVSAYLDVHNNIAFANAGAPDFRVVPDCATVQSLDDLVVTGNDFGSASVCADSPLDPSNTSIAPWFIANGAPDVHLRAADVRLIDAGTSFLVPREDFEGDSIPLDGGSGRLATDIGADEYDPANPGGPTTIVLVPAASSIGIVGGSVTAAAQLDHPAKRDLVLSVAQFDTNVDSPGQPLVVAMPQHLKILKGASSVAVTVQALSAARHGSSRIAISDPGGKLVAGEGNVSVAIEPPVAVALSSPSGAIAATTPTFTWAAQPGVEAYQLWVGTGSSTAVSAWFTALEAGCATGSGACAVMPAVTLATGSWYFNVKARSAAGTGPWTVAKSFAITTMPTVATLVAPSGQIATSRPIYRWNALSGVDSYQLWVGTGSSTALSVWYTAAQAGCATGAGVCSATPATSLAAGTWYFNVKGKNALGSGPWANPSMSFSVPGVPGELTLISPTGPVAASRPTYRWNAQTGAEQYQLWVGTGSSTALSAWYTAAEAGCASGTGVCSVAPATALAEGAWFFNVRGKNFAGTGPWAASKPFTYVLVPVPLALTLLSPSGPAGTSTPSFSWAAQPGVDSYQLWAGTGTSTAVSVWYAASSVGCGGGTGTCSASPGTAFAAGTWYFNVRGRNLAGTGPWAAAKSFSAP